MKFAINLRTVFLLLCPQITVQVNQEKLKDRRKRNNRSVKGCREHANKNDALVSSFRTSAV